jgi:hypothetical protein
MMRVSISSRRGSKHRELLYFIVLVVALLVITSLTLPV